MPGNALSEGGCASSCEEGGRERPCPNDEGSDKGTDGADDAGGPAEEAIQSRGSIPCFDTKCCMQIQRWA